MARQSFTIAEPMGDHEAIAWSRYQIGSVGFRRGNLLSARLNLEFLSLSPLLEARASFTL